MTRALHRVGAQLFPDEWPATAEETRRNARFWDVARRMREHLAYGRLTAFLQETDGTFHEVPSEIWNTQQYEEWFIDFTAPASTIDIRNSITTRLPLFVGRSHLQQIVAGDSVSVTLPEGDVYIPPYMRLMLAVYREQEMSRSHQLTIDALADELLKASKRPGFPALSQTLAKKAATLMREPESQSGSASYYERQKTKGG